jgi:monoamine oxidase
MADVVDVAVVGAGLSGLQAALDLQLAGRSVIVLEARDRVGGKTYSVQRQDGKGVQEVGAAWINDTNQSHIWKYCKDFGLTPVVQNIEGLVASEDGEGECHMFPFGELPRVRNLSIRCQACRGS